MEFKNFSRKGLAQARELGQNEGLSELRAAGISVSAADAENFGTVPPGMVFRNPEDHYDQWYVARAWFDANYQPA